MDRTGQPRGVLRIVSVSLSFLLAFGMMTALPTAAFADDEYVCMVGDVKYKSFDDALGKIPNGGTVKLLANTRTVAADEVWLTYPDERIALFYAGIYVNGRTLIIDTNGFALDAGKLTTIGPSYGSEESYYFDYGLWVVNGGELKLIDSSVEQTGQLIVGGNRAAVKVEGEGSKATVSLANGIKENGALAQDGGSIVITGDVTGGSDFTIRAESGGSVTVNGNVISDATCGVLADGANTTVEIKGNLSAAQGTGVQAVGGATVSIDGTLTASDYIKLGTSSDNTTSYPKESGRTSQRKPNYYEYTDNTNYVYVRSDGSIIDDGVGAPGSGDLYGSGHTSMDVARVAARVAVGIEVNLTPEQFAAIDMDFDGALTMTDVLLIMRKACGL